MLFADVSNSLVEEDPQETKTLEMEKVNLLMTSLMQQHSRTTFLSLLPTILSQWDLSHKSLIETKPK